MRYVRLLLLFLIGWEPGRAAAAPLGTAFTFQGRLLTTNGPAQGPHDFDFALWDRADGGNLLGAVTREEWPVSNGLFTVDLDFGGAALSEGAERFIEVTVKLTAATNSAVTLAPRTRLAPAPFAVTAANVPDGSIGTAKIAAGAVDASRLASGAVGYAQLGDWAVDLEKLADGAVTSNKLAAGAVHAQHLAGAAVGSHQLADDAVTTPKLTNAAVTAPKIALGAVSNQHLAAGAVGAIHLQAGSVNSSKIADGSIQGADLAVGAVTATNLAKPYRSGELAFGLNTWTFAPLVVTQAFTPAFAATPVVTVQVDQQADDEVDRAFSARLLARSASGFSARVSSPILHAPLAMDPNSYYIPALVQVGSGTNIRPAFTAVWSSSPKLCGFHYGRRDGTGWYSIVLSTNGTHPQAVTLLNQQPGVAFVRVTDGRLVFTRSPDSLFQTWLAEVLVDAAATNLLQPQTLIAAGRPAVAYSGNAGGGLQFRFARAADTNGSVWGSISLPAPALTGTVLHATLVQDHPTLLLEADDALFYVRANNAEGTTWGSPLLLTNRPVDHATCQMVNGRPAVVYCGLGSSAVAFLRALDATGQSWGTAVDVAPYSGGLQDAPVDFLVANERPVVLYRQHRELITVEGRDADGVLWGEPRPVAEASITPSITRGMRFRGGLAVVFISPAAGESEFIWAGGPPPERLQWTAVLP